MTLISARGHRQAPLLDDDASIWSGTDPAAAAVAAKAAHGPDATLAVAWCALSAKLDGRVTDGHFWFEVFCLLCAGETPATGFPSGADSVNADGKLH